GQEGSGQGYGIYAQRYNSAGVAQGGEVHVNTATAGNQRFPTTAALENGGYVIAWQDSTSTEIQFQRYNSSGVAQGTNTVASASAPGNQSDPAIAGLSTGGFVVVWTSSDDGGGSGIYAQRFTASGTADGSTILINTTTSGEQVAASVSTLVNGSFVVTWTSADAANNGIFQKIVEANTVPYLDDAQAELSAGTEDTPYTVSRASLLQGVEDDEGHTMTITGLTVDHGTAVADGSNWIITPSANYNGPLVLSYTVSDGHGGTLNLTQDLTINAVNDAPSVEDGELDTTVDEGASSITFDALSNVTDVEHGALSVSASGLPAGVTLVDSTFTFNPANAAYDYLADGETEEVVVSYTVSDGTSTTGASFTITVTGTNDAPVFEVCGDDTGSVTEDAGVLVSLIGTPVEPAETQTATGDITFTDVDLSDTHTVEVESHEIITSLVGSYVHAYVGTLTAEVTQAVKGGGGTVNWTFSVDNDDIQFLAEGQTLTQSYDVIVSDGWGGEDTETVVITITGNNDAPTLSGEQASLDDGEEDQDYTVSKADLLQGFSDVDTSDDLDIDNLTASDGATVTDNHDGTYTIHHVANDNGRITLSYDVIDGNGGSVEGGLSYDLDAVNDAPVGNDSVSIQGTEDTDLVIDIADLISDVDNSDGQLTITAESDDGQVTIDGTEITFIPNGDFQGTTTITYTVEDPDGETDTGTLYVNIANTNDAPEADDFNGGTTPEETPIVIDVNGHFEDIDPGETLTVTAATSEQGTVSINGTELTFTPASNFYGNATITYAISDGETTTTADITVAVTNTYDAPTVVPGAAIDMLEDTVKTITAAELLAGVENPDDAEITISDVFASEGTITLNQNGTYRYNPPNDYYGPVTINFTVFDGTTEVLSEITINIENVNDAPHAPTSPGSLGSVNEDAVFTGSDEALLTGWTDIDFERDEENTLPDLVVSDISVNHGTVVRDGHGGFTITPDEDYNGTITVTYKVSDGVTEVTATRSLTVTPQPDAPDLTGEPADLTGALEDHTFNITTASLLQGITDPDGGSPSFTITAIDVDEGAINLVSGNYVYTPDADFNGDVTITYTVSDGSLTRVLTNTFTVGAVNDAPGGSSASISGVLEDTDTFITVSDLLAGVTDVDNITAQLEITDIDATNGTIVWNEAQEHYVFRGDSNYSGTATITYTVSDGEDDTEYTSTFSVGAVNDAPTGTAGTITGASEDTVTNISRDTLLSGISDVDNPTKSGWNIHCLSATNGTFASDGSGGFTFTPTANYNGSASITYKVSDGSGGSTIFTSTFSVAAVNDNPTAPEDPVDLGTATEDQPIIIDAEDLLAGWTDIDGPTTFTVHNLDAGDGFTVVDNHDGTFTVTTPDDYRGEIAFTYEVHDATTGVSYGEATIEVQNVYDAPELDEPAELSDIDEDTSKAFTTADLLQGWSSADGETLSVQNVDISFSGGLTGFTMVSGSGNYSLSPLANEWGTFTISYDVYDGHTTTSTSLSFDVNPVIDLVCASTSTVLATGIDNLKLTGSDDIDGTGNSLNNV
ncbi:beta strand repeat-containing protein, partial [Asticcacaulis sp. AC460]|uniref:beta strand repeat-containing protein n=1 Tax=Asticcacaulis sp. AC460 TaxID=1282360 RepID=UPI0004CF26D0